LGESAADSSANSKALHSITTRQLFYWRMCFHFGLSDWLSGSTGLSALVVLSMPLEEVDWWRCDNFNLACRMDARQQYRVAPAPSPAVLDVRSFIMRDILRLQISVKMLSTVLSGLSTKELADNLKSLPWIATKSSLSLLWKTTMLNPLLVT
jgi:hypothetical protein